MHQADLCVVSHKTMVHDCVPCRPSGCRGVLSLASLHCHLTTAFAILHKHLTTCARLPPNLATVKYRKQSLVPGFFLVAMIPRTWGHTVLHMFCRLMRARV
jgi:hypothetical protein